MNRQVIEDITNRLASFKNFYDYLRIVDPINKTAWQVDKLEGSEVKSLCYGLWEKDMMCSNCVSVRAFNENDTFVKLEYKGGKIYLITASPFTLNDRTYIVELLKDITKNNSLIDTKVSDIAKTNKILDKLNCLVITDELTGLYNKRYINERLPADIHSSYTQSEPITVIMGDIDFFKNINDNYGHVAGDKILKELGTLLISSVRSSTDWVARYGGEEFLIALNNTSIEKARVAAEKIRTIVENYEFCLNGNKVKLSVSLGVCCLNEEGEEVCAESLINCADKNLYKAKRTGRNKVVISNYFTQKDD
ncbi:GGDEF domain-containing protein [Clostridium swellfunianum]|uniref:GGDEF domain-containing protein n=1 Tax=Clostridium swellfunianum TaxID=1367462 RepID=UPI00202E5683|nr:GGDEF domain-containing protein [Clostridium swellfunianum]MCM0650143.1 GGDEF domain-containing protein [Clostridium swellfunianum]